MRFPREFWTPKDPEKVISRADLNAVVYYPKDHSGKGKPLAMGFSGKRAKFDWYLNFTDEAQREKYVETWLKNMEARKDAQAQHKADKKRLADEFLRQLSPGKILVDTWGYEQTQVEFYQVIERKGSKVLLQEMSHVTEPGSEGRDCCRVTPGTAHGPMTWHNVRSNYVRINSCIALHLWSGGSVYKSWYY